MVARCRTALALAAVLALAAGGAAAFADAPIGRRPPPSATAKRLERLGRKIARQTGHKPPPPKAIPTRSQVKTPVYPHAWYLRAMPRGKMVELDLATRASPKKVTAFYEKALGDKGYAKKSVTSAHLVVFQKGGDLSQWYAMGNEAVWVEPLKCDTAITTYYSRRICGKHHSEIKIYVPAKRIPKADLGT